MKKRLLFLIFGIVLAVLVSGCAQQDRQTGEIPTPKEEMNEISPAQEQIVNATSIEPPAENNQLEEKVELTFEQAVWKKRIDAAMTPSYCPPVTKVEYPSSYYQGPLIDTHYHLPSLPESALGEEEGAEGEYGPEPLLGQNIKMSEIACTLQHEGTTRNFALFPIYPEIYPYPLEIAKRAKEQYPELFTPFMDYPNPPEVPEGIIIKSEMLSEILAAYPGLFQGWGEISLYVQKDGSGRYFPPDLPIFTEIYPIIRKNKMMVWMHPGENQEDNFERVLKQNPDINFIVHGDQIKDGISSLMSKYPNIYFCINNFYANQDIFLLPNGKKSFFAVFENYESLIQKDLRAWKSLIEAHPDQVIWCLDREEKVLWTFDRDVGLKLVDYARAFIGRLDPSVQEKFAYKNAEKLLQER